MPCGILATREYTGPVLLAAAFLAIILSLLSRTVQRKLRPWFRTRLSVVLAAAGIASVFCAEAAYERALSVPLACLVFAYALCPALCIAARRKGERAGLLDFGAILLLWLPLETGAGGTLVRRPVQGILHANAYGMAITLALVLFLLHTRFEGMRYELPRSVSDLRVAVVGFLCAAVVLIPLGYAVGFLGPAHTPRNAAPLSVLLRVFLIFAGTALPEEILFRSLIQNWLVQTFGATNVVIAVAALIFGLAHLNNAPGPAPNWPYAIVAFAAGLIFGKVFQASRSVISSALVHTGVNTVKYLFF